jgi:hypothetical protein
MRFDWMAAATVAPCEPRLHGIGLQTPVAADRVMIGF